MDIVSNAQVVDANACLLEAFFRVAPLRVRT